MVPPAGFAIADFPIARMPVNREWVAIQTIHKYTRSYMSYRRLKAIFECAPNSFSNWAESREAIMVTNDVEPYTIVWVNTAFEQLYGYTLSEVQGETQTVLHGPQTDRITAHMNRLECTQIRAPGENRLTSMLHALTLHTKANVPLVTHMNVSHHHLYPFGVQFKREDAQYFAHIGSSATSAFVFKMLLHEEHPAASSSGHAPTWWYIGHPLDPKNPVQQMKQRGTWVIPSFDAAADPIVADRPSRTQTTACACLVQDAGSIQL